jgi:hypothetical protein
MATYTSAGSTYRGQSSGAGPLARNYAAPVGIQYSLVDLADVLTAAGTNAFSNGDIIEAIRIPAGSIVLNAGVKVITAFSTNATVFNFGTAGGSNYMDNATASAVGFLTGSNATVNTIGRFASADTLDLKIVSGSTGLTTGLVLAYAVIADVTSLGRRGNVSTTTNLETVPASTD